MFGSRHSKTRAQVLISSVYRCADAPMSPGGGPGAPQASTHHLALCTNGANSRKMHVQAKSMKQYKQGGVSFIRSGKLPHDRCQVYFNFRHLFVPGGRYKTPKLGFYVGLSHRRASGYSLVTRSAHRAGTTDNGEETLLLSNFLSKCDPTELSKTMKMSCICAARYTSH